MSKRQMSSAFRTVSPVDDEADDELLYPSSDGEPVGETDWHVASFVLLREALEDFFAKRADVYVATDIFLYYVRGDTDACVAPDAMVVKGVAKGFRRVFRTWVEKAIPCVIIEICSEETWRRDLREKRTDYERLGIKEYFIFDPEAKYLKPPLRGFRLRGRKYQELKPNARGELLSKELGLRLVREDYMLRLVDAASGQPVLTHQEAKTRAEERAGQAEERAGQAEERADQAEERAAALEAELAELRARQGNRRGSGQ